MTKKNIKILEEILANSYILLVKTQNYHWNIRGNNFVSIHELLGNQYQDIFLAIDEIAERIRVFDVLVDGTIANFLKISKIKEAKSSLSNQKMIEDLIDSNEALSKMLEKAIKEVQKENDEGTADLFIKRVQSHQKNVWMLKAINN